MASREGNYCRLEKVESGQINVGKIPPALSRLSRRLGEKRSDGPSLLPNVAYIDLDKQSTVATNNVIVRGWCSAQDLLEGKNEEAAASFSCFESKRTKKRIHSGYFGTLCNGTDVAIKSKSTDLLRGGGVADDQKGKKTLLVVREVR
jgi:hypothetical protein